MSPTVRIGRRNVPGRARAGRQNRYTVEELAELSGLTARTIRSYQTQGLLQPPEHRGRTAYYDDVHADRLAAISELKERGLSLSEIHDVLSRREAGERAARQSEAGPRPRPRPRAPAEAPAPPTATLAGPAATPSLVIEREERSRRRRWRGVLTGVALVALVGALATESWFFFSRMEEAEADRRRLARQISELRSEIARLPKEPAPPVTVMVPVAGPPAPSPAPPTAATSAPPPAAAGQPTAARTVVPASPPPTAPPAPPPQPCTTLPIINRCL